MALLGSLRRCCHLLLCLGLLVSHGHADDDTAAASVNPMTPVRVCTWPVPESAVMSCDSGSLILISETYMTRLVGRSDKCPTWNAVGRPEYAACRLPLTADLLEKLMTNCNYTEHCTFGSFFTGPVVVTGSTLCGNGSDNALERNFLVVKWGCVGYVPTTPTFDDVNGTDFLFHDGNFDSSTSKLVWIVPLCACIGVLLLGGLLVGLLIWRRDFIKKKARELRRLRREQRRQAKLQLAAAGGGQPPSSDTPDGGTADTGARRTDVASWIDRAPSYSAVASVDGTLTKSTSGLSMVASGADALPPAYSQTSVVTVDEFQREQPTERRRHQHRRRGDGEQLVLSSSSVSGEGGSNSRRHRRSTADRSRSHDRSTSGGGKKSRSGGGKRRSRPDGTTSELSDMDLERRRRRREQLYKGATHHIRKPDELCQPPLSSSTPSNAEDRTPETAESPRGGSDGEQTVVSVPSSALSRRSST